MSSATEPLLSLDSTTRDVSRCHEATLWDGRWRRGKHEVIVDGIKRLALFPPVKGNARLMALECRDERLFHAKDCVYIEIGVACDEDVGDQWRKAQFGDPKVDVCRTHRAAPSGCKHHADWSVVRDRVGYRLD